jgi:hypothetical protein
MKVDTKSTFHTNKEVNMKIGDEVKITNINKMWCKEIYLAGGIGLNEVNFMESEGFEVIPDFDDIEFFENGDIAKIVEKDGRTFLETTLSDNNGDDFICESQYYTLEELETFCEVI